MGLRSRLKRRVKGLIKSEDVAKPSSVPAPLVQASPETPVEEEEMPEIEVADAELAEWIASDRKTVLLDIREPIETRSGFAKGALLIPMNSIPDRLDDLPDRDVCLLVYCAAGVRSFGVTHWLREQGWEEAWSVTGGFAAVVGAGVEREVV
jgi:rhodanese-related sulfurtransferase